MRRNKVLLFGICIGVLCCVLIVIGFSKPKVKLDAVLILNEQEAEGADISISIRTIDRLMLRQLNGDITLKRTDGEKLENINAYRWKIPIKGRVSHLDKYYIVSGLAYSASLDAYRPASLYFDRSFENLVFTTETCKIIAANEDFCCMIEKSGK